MAWKRTPKKKKKQQPPIEPSLSLSDDDETKEMPVVVETKAAPELRSIRERQAVAGAGWRSIVPPRPKGAPPADECSSEHWNPGARKFIYKAKPEFSKKFYEKYGNNKVAISAD